VKIQPAIPPDKKSHMKIQPATPNKINKIKCKSTTRNSYQLMETQSTSSPDEKSNVKI
jgi:hypothetical protein